MTEHSNSNVRPGSTDFAVSSEVIASRPARTLELEMSATLAQGVREGSFAAATAWPR